MSLARLQSRAPNGLDAPPVSVEIHLSGGLPSFAIVGLPEAAVRESRERVRSALINSGFDFPARRITANLAPADIPSRGAALICRLRSASWPRPAKSSLRSPICRGNTSANWVLEASSVR